MKNQVLLSGIAPSGNLHVGNYLGALKQWVDLQKDYRVFAMIADLHALTTPQDPLMLHSKTLEVAALMQAAGIDGERSLIFIQSHVPAHAELSWILNTITPLGELERMTQFKEKKERSGMLAGLLNYPTLMAADILLYKTEVVPVGDDQVQHLELTRTLARKFNGRFGNTLKEPKALIQKNVSRIMGLDDPMKKMSKSAENPDSYIALLDAPEVITRKIKKAVTDSGKEIIYNEKEKPAISNLLALFGAFSRLSIKQVEDRFKGASYADFKKELARLLVSTLTPLQEKYKKIMQNPKQLEEILHESASGAAAIANPTLREVKEKIGLLL